MGARDRDRLPRLRTLAVTPPGHVRMGRCLGCGYQAALPVALLLARFGELYPVELAIGRLHPTSCGGRKIESLLARLCSPDCLRRR